MSNIATLQPQAVETRMNALVPTNIEQAIRLADVMAQANLMPEHLRNKPGDCLLVVMQAQRWGLDAVSVAQCTSVVHGKLCYEGKLVASVLYAMGAVEGRLHYEIHGSGLNASITVTGKPRGGTGTQSVTGSVKDWRTYGKDKAGAKIENAWDRMPEDMLVYRGTRQWARRYAPEALLGVYTPDELEDAPMQTINAAQATATARAEPDAYPDESLERNLPAWRQLITTGRKTADEIIAMVSSKATLSDQQKSRIRALAPIEGEAKEVAA